MDLGAYLDAARAFDRAFRARWEPVEAAPATEVDEARLAAASRTTTRSSTPATPARCSSRPIRWPWPATWPP
jgi:hypothetical protein